MGRDWKILGEVPDSDEEDEIQSEDSQHRTLSTDHTAGEKLPEVDAYQDGHDVWSIASSPDPLSRQQDALHENSIRNGPSTNPLTRLPHGKDKDAGTTEAPNGNYGRREIDESDVARAINGHEPCESQNEAPTPEASQTSILSSLNDEISPRDDHALTVLEDAGDIGASDQAGKSETAQVSDTAQAAAAFEARSAGRSLRPRKLIQQHPYLIENAQYSGLMKSHGVRPIRIPNMAERSPAKTRREDEDSQEQDIVNNDSQAQGPGEHSNGTLDPFDDDMSIFAFASSPLSSGSQRADPALVSSVSKMAKDTDASSTSESEFPTVENLLGACKAATPSSKKRKAHDLHAMAGKRHRTTMSSSPQRRPRLHLRGFVRSPSPSEAGLMRAQELLAATTARLKDTSSDLISVHNPRSVANSFDSPQRLIRVPTLINFSTDSDDDDNTDAEVQPDESLDVVRRTGKRIKGLLPASWLRLDQKRHTARSPVLVNRPLTPPFDLEEPRKGVAIVKRKAGPGRSSDVFSFLNDDGSGSEGDDSVKMLADAVHDSESASQFMPEANDDAVIIEHDIIDDMITGVSRHKDHLRVGKKSSKRRAFFSQSDHKRYRQQHLATDFARVAHRAIQGSASKVPNVRQSRIVRSPMPKLSIVDMIDDSAPRFVRLAARAAARQRDAARVTPTKKLIDLGSKNDNADVFGVLGDWRSGKFRAKTRSTTAPQIRQPLAPTSGNPRRPPCPPKQMSLLEHVSTDSVRSNAKEQVELQTNLIEAPISRKTQKSRQQKSWEILEDRPAQLEVADALHPLQSRLQFRKHMLDRLHSKGQKQHVRQLHAGTIEAWREPAQKDCVSLDAPKCKLSKPAQSRARRKLNHPRRVDVFVPRYLVSQDLAPTLSPANAGTATPISDKGFGTATKLLNLGPFGTTYTCDFGVYPLIPGTYFHESTIIGNGTMKDILEIEVSSDGLTTTTAALNLDLEERHFQWEKWNANVSSELGVLVDWIADVVFEVQDDLADRKAQLREASDFMLKFLCAAAKNAGKEEQHSIAARLDDLLQGWLARYSTSHPTPPSQRFISLLSTTGSRLLLLAYLSVMLRRTLDPWSSATSTAEQLLVRCAQVLMSALLTMEPQVLRSKYERLHSRPIREHGIREDDAHMCTWTILFKVLHHVQIPRQSFWSILESVSFRAKDEDTCDVSILEAKWEMMSTLLPLSGFDNNGMRSASLEDHLASDGWSIPQRLLKRVFAIVKVEPSQSPNFNEYCRTLLRRCHRLMQQWGWRRANGVLGVILDFFGQRGLAHLRNEITYKSPAFLDDLGGNPSLLLVPEDKAFHIFLKMLAMSLKQLNNQGHIKEMRNLVTRVLPNHDRQYLKEQDVREDDLGALRNHHDLLCTLFWAASPETRPSVQLIEKLITPRDAHKEACLINIRTWQQVANFAVSTKAGSAVFEPLLTWQDSFVQQISDQYQFAATDIQQQYMALPKEDRAAVTTEHLAALTRSNQSVARDVIFASLKASESIMRLCCNLTEAVWSMNINQLQKVLEHHVLSKESVDESMLEACLHVVEVFIGLLSEASDDQYSSGFDDAGQVVLEDATTMLDRRIVEPLFAVLRGIFSRVELGVGLHTRYAAILERTVVTCGRAASHLIKQNGLRLDNLFMSGCYSMFSGPPLDVGATEKKHLPLVIGTLLKNHVSNFQDLDGGLLEVWTTTIVQPSRCLGYEGYLAEAMQSYDLNWMHSDKGSSGFSKEYSVNHDRFMAIVTYMRRSLRESDSGHRRQMRNQYERVLRMSMQQIKKGLRIVVGTPSERRPYITFARQIVALIKSHGGDICPVDPYFYQSSAEYEPAETDPQMHAAVIDSYGLRLEEGETSAVPRLFHFLYNNFVTALMTDRLGDEKQLVARTMRTPSILGFMLEHMLPAVVSASAACWEAWPLLQIYTFAMQKLLTEPVAPMQVPVAYAGGMLKTLSSIVRHLRDLRMLMDVWSDVYVAMTYKNVVNSLRLCASLSSIVTDWRLRHPSVAGLETACDEFRCVLSEVASINAALSTTREEIQANPGSQRYRTRTKEQQTESLTQHIIEDLGRRAMQIARTTDRPGVWDLRGADRFEASQVKDELAHEIAQGLKPRIAVHGMSLEDKSTSRPYRKARR